MSENAYLTKPTHHEARQEVAGVEGSLEFIIDHLDTVWGESDDIKRILSDAKADTGQLDSGTDQYFFTLLESAHRVSSDGNFGDSRSVGHRAFHCFNSSPISPGR